MNTLFFDIETYSNPMWIDEADILALKKRKSNEGKTEQDILTEQAFNPYLANVITISASVFNESNNTIHYTLVWYLTETPSNKSITTTVNYCDSTYKVTLLPASFTGQTKEEILQREKWMLAGFFDLSKKVDRVVTYNGKRFDSQFLFIRGLFHELEIPTWLIEHKNQDNKTKHIDIAEFLSKNNYTNLYSLDFITRNLGLQSPKMQYDGSMVKTLFEEKRYAEIAKYCALDTIALMNMYQKIKKYIAIAETQKNKPTEKQLSLCQKLISSKPSQKDEMINFLLNNADKQTISDFINNFKS